MQDLDAHAQKFALFDDPIADSSLECPFVMLHTGPNSLPKWIEGQGPF